mgnify:CR=1 FL=1|jgi:nucleoside-triphosphatase
MEKKITVVTGERGAGKSTYCLNRVEKARKENRIVRGILSPAVYHADRKTGFYTRDLATDVQLLTGSVTAEPGLTERFYRWYLNPAAITWGNQILTEIDSCDLLIIDEIGPLEFKEQRGFTAAFSCLRSATYQEALVVLRPECLPDFNALGFAFNTHEIIKGE